MKRSYFPRQCWSLSGVLVVMVLFFAATASAQAPSIEGTYQLISRQLPDGTILRPPDIMGLFTYTKNHRNFNFVRRDAAGKFSSTSSVSTYKLTATEYSETVLFSIANDQIRGKDIVYDLSGQTRSVPVTVDGGRIQFKAPFGRRSRDVRAFTLGDALLGAFALLGVVLIVWAFRIVRTGAKQKRELDKYEFENRTAGGVVQFRTFEDSEQHGLRRDKIKRSRNRVGCLLIYGVLIFVFAVGLYILIKSDE